MLVFILEVTRKQQQKLIPSEQYRDCRIIYIFSFFLHILVRCPARKYNGAAAVLRADCRVQMTATTGADTHGRFNFKNTWNFVFHC